MKTLQAVTAEINTAPPTWPLPGRGNLKKTPLVPKLQPRNEPGSKNRTLNPEPSS